MQSIRLNTILTSARARKDGSLGVTLETPELTPSEKVAVMELQGLALDTLISPIDFKAGEHIVIDKEAGEKSPSQRLRGVMFVYWSEKKIETPFETWYRRQIEGLIEKYKNVI